jgi:uncharacterized protein
MSDKEIIEKTKAFVETKFKDEGSGHDWWHLYRVWRLAKHIGKKENANMLVVQLGALLHDIADFKFYGGDLTAGPRASAKLLKEIGVDEPVIKEVTHIVEHVSFKGAGEANMMQSLEGKIVQDADRLDAIGAMGISRVFAYGGHKGNVIYDPKVKPTMHDSFEQYKNSDSSAINHFYEKLLLLKDRMNTKTGKEMAEHRHKYMEEYLKEFFAEWDGKL